MNFWSTSATGWMEKKDKERKESRGQTNRHIKKKDYRIQTNQQNKRRVNIGLCTKYTAEDEKDKYAIESVLTDRRKRRVK